VSGSLDSLPVVIVGHVDHGKSTLIGRLLNDTKSLPDGKVDAVKAMCERRGMPFEWAFVMDAFQAERDQGITIDATQIRFSTTQRDYLIIDAPGHREFIKNMITGAASADAAVLVIEAAEGVQRETRRHAFLLHLLGIRQVCVVVNKMDAIAFDQTRFDTVQTEIVAYLASIGVEPSFVIPVCARDGDNISRTSDRVAWYDGPTLTGALDSFAPSASSQLQPLRFPIQDIYKFDDRRIVAGRIESGTLSVGDPLLFSPSNKVARIVSIETWNAPEALTTATAGSSVGITLDDDLFIERGDIASHEVDAPLETDVFRARIFWLGDKELALGATCRMKLTTLDVPVTVQEVSSIVDTETLAHSAGGGVGRHQVAEVVLRARRVLALDEATEVPRTGRFALAQNHRIVGGGTISMGGYADQRRNITQRATNVVRVEHRIDATERAERAGHCGGVIWLTGLSASGKSTLALELERRLFERGYQVYVLDGDNIRHGLNADLGFSPEERSENIRRVGEVGALFARAGFIALSAFISPYRSDRTRAREAAEDGMFHEVFVKADLATCEARDPKGLYKKARAGEIADFTGIDAPYEVPEAPEFIVDTSGSTIDASVDALIAYITDNFTLRP
jgi:bifunctional enzyme CysN/CysC